MCVVKICQPARKRIYDIFELLALVQIWGNNHMGGNKVATIVWIFRPYALANGDQHLFHFLFMAITTEASGFYI